MQGGGHFVVGQAVAGHGALEQLDGHRLHRALVVPLRRVNDAGRAFAQGVRQAQAGPGDVGAGWAGGGGCWRIERIAGAGQPGQARHGQQPTGQGAELVGRNAQQRQLLALGQFGRQDGQLVAGQHELLQVAALADAGGQARDLVVGQDQPAQAGGQGGAGHVADLVGLEANHVELAATAQHGWQLGEPVTGAKQHPQRGQAGQVVGQVAELVA